MPHAAVSVIVPVRAAPGFIAAFTLMVLLIEPDGGVTVTHDKDSETTHVELEVTFTV